MITLKFFSDTDHGVYLRAEKPVGEFVKQTTGFGQESREVTQVLIPREDIEKLAAVVINEVVRKLSKDA